MDNEMQTEQQTEMQTDRRTAVRAPHTNPIRTAALALALALALAGTAPAPLAATPPQLVDYQGVLRDSEGQPLDGTFDMTFRFFDQAVGGSMILIDEHVAPDGIVVEGGLFAVQIGSGDVNDGAGAYPDDPFAMQKTFRDYAALWLEIEIEGETLSPRTRVAAAPYALNATYLNGRGASNFLDTSPNAQSKIGKLTVGGVDVQGDLRLIDPFFKSIYFEDGGDPQGQHFRFDGADHVFESSAGLQLDGILITGDPTMFPTGFNRFGTETNPQGGAMDGRQDLFVGEDLEAAGEAWFGGDLEAGGIVRFNGHVQIDDDGPDGDQRVRFWNDGGLNEELKWDEAGDRFEFSDSLAIAGALRTGQTQAAPEGFNHLGDLGKTPDSDDMSGPQDLYVEGDVEIEEHLYLGGHLMMLDIGPDTDGDGDPNDVDQFIFFYDNGTMDDEWIKWEDGTSAGTGGGTIDRFEMSDSLHVFGDLTALNKNFVQNYPGRDDLEIVYTTLEGDEATVFTRGHARLVAGEARVPLGPTFPLVAHPELGLSAHLTPRGAAHGLYVAGLTSDELVVRSDEPGADAAFDYIVYGLRLGYEDQPVVRPRRGDAPIPARDRWDAVFAAMPEARAQTAGARYVAMSFDALGRDAAAGSAAAEELRRAIGEGDEDAAPRDFTPSGAPAAFGADADGEQGVGAVALARGAWTGDSAAASTKAAPRDARMHGANGSGTSDASNAPDAPAVARDLVARSFRPERGGVASAWAARGEIEPGDVVVLDRDGAGMRRADRIEDPTVIGIATADAGVLFGAGDGIDGSGDGDGSTGRVGVALSGIVPCKVDADLGAIRPGDLLVASPNPGHAMRRDDPLPGTVVGKALQALDSGTGTIRVLVVQR